MLAILFPGQGSQTPDDAAVVDRYAPDLLERAVRQLGDDPFPRIDQSTAWAQAAIHLASAAHWRRLQGTLDASPGAFAGHSLGEISALSAAGALTEEDALDLVIARGRAMAEARAGAMVAVRADADAAAPVAEAHDWVVANDNAPGQVVLSGSADRADDLQAALRAAGLRAMRLPVTGAFHSPLMADAAEAFAQVLAQTPFAQPAVPVFCCATAAPFDDPRFQLASAITAPVRWRELLHGLAAAGVTRYLDAGPGTVIDGLVRRTLPEVERVVGSVPA